MASGPGVSSSDATAAGVRGDTKIIAQGQTSGPYGNDPFEETKQSRDQAGMKAISPN